jgi:hypothetical protein
MLMDPIEIKEDLDIQYHRNLSNNNGRQWHFKKPHTNSHSGAGSRPDSHKGKHSLDNTDTVNYTAIDYIQISIPYRKTAAPKIVSYDRITMNKQIHSIPRLIEANKQVHSIPQPIQTNKQIHPVPRLTQTNSSKIPEPRFISVDQIHPSIIISNKAGLSEIKNMAVLINLSDSKIKIPKVSVYDLKLQDCRTVSFLYFVDILKKVISIISKEEKFLSGDKIVVCCEKGVNRSVAMVIGYAIVSNIMTCINALEYVNEVKNKKYSNWYSMNNLKFVRYLRLLEQNKIN